MTAPIRTPNARSRGTSAASSRVTSSPRPRQVAATSAPMNPAPTTTTRPGRRSSSRRRPRQSSSVRSTCTPAIDSDPGQATGGGTGGQDQSVVAQPVTTVEADETVGQVDGHGPPAELEVEIEILAHRGQHDAVRFPLAGQHLLGQRRLVVGRVGVGVDDGDATVEPLAAEGVGGVHPGQGCTHHHHRAHHRAVWPSPRSARRAGLTPRRSRWPAWGSVAPLPRPWPGATRAGVSSST